MTTPPWTGLNVLITGVCGTVGSELLRQLMLTDCGHITGVDNNETELFFQSEASAGNPRVELFLCDLRNRDDVMRHSRGVDVVLHAAALKHVVLCERSPRDAVATNIQGLMNVVDAAERHGVRRLLFTSSDKAVNPSNVMGTTKLMGERIVTAANAHRRDTHDTIFASTRFGNVLGSRGSVIPLFARQIARGGPVTVTDTAMTRFIMTIEAAVALVLESTFMARGGEVFVTKMPVVRIADLAAVMIDRLAPRHGFRPGDIPVDIIGCKPGEKMYEDLLNEEEVRRTVELRRFFAVTPAFKAVYQSIQYDYDELVSSTIERPYNSALQTPLSRDELANYLDRHSVLQGDACAF
jgi:FlaA1/EpsC-like NDP-sugar epimerase